MITNVYAILPSGETVKLHDINETNSAIRLTNAEITKEINAIDSFKFRIFPNHPQYNTLEPLSTRVYAVSGEFVEQFRGRVLTVDSSMDNDGKIYKDFVCEGILGYFCDSIQEQEKFTSGELISSVISKLITRHNECMDASPTGEVKKYYLGNIATAGLSAAYECDYEITLDALKNICVDAMGGELRVRYADGKNYIDFAAKGAPFGKKSATKIELAVNMKEITQERDTTAIVSDLYPLGAKMANGKRLTVVASGKTNGAPYIRDNDIAARYGVVAASVIFDNIEVEDPTDISKAALKLYNAGKAYMDTVNYEKRQYSVTALDLSEIYIDYDEFEVGNTYAVINSLMGIDEELRVLSKTIDINEPQNSSLTFGDKFSTLSNMVINAKKEASAEVISARNAMQTTVDYITGGKGGYVVTKFNDDNQPIATYYSDNLDLSKAKEMLMINNRGILGSTDGGASYNTAIDIQGRINASQITTGTLEGITIKSNNAIITGGSININTNAETQSAVSLHYSGWNAYLAAGRCLISGTIDGKVHEASLSQTGVFGYVGGKKAFTLTSAEGLSFSTDGTTANVVIAPDGTITCKKLVQTGS